MPCGSVTVVADSDLETNRLCSEIQGDLKIATAGLSAITADDFPYLTKVTGVIYISQEFNTAPGPALESVALAHVQTAGGFMINETEDGRVKEVILTALATLTGATLKDVSEPGLYVESSYIKTLELPALTTINGNVVFVKLPRLCTAVIRNVTDVGGFVQLQQIPNLSPGALVSIYNAKNGQAIESQVGCCILSSEPGCQSFTGTASCGC